jgi:hypothetical protein
MAAATTVPATIPSSGIPAQHLDGMAADLGGEAEGHRVSERQQTDIAYQQVDAQANKAKHKMFMRKTG